MTRDSSELPRDKVVPAEADRAFATKVERLLEILRVYPPTAVAFSAGVDSSVVAMAAFVALGEKAIAVTANSASLPQGELEEASRIAAQIGIRHITLTTDEFANPAYVANPSNRCYFCKTELYDQVWDAREKLGIEQIVNGANLDDRGDHRPGMVAATEHHVRSPLIEAEFTKADVRRLARQWNLPTWDKPAAPCLSSRIAYGVEVTPERVRRVDDAERFLRERFNLRELRVRLEANDLARIEVPLTEIASLASDDARKELVEKFTQLGFKNITLDLAGFRSGSLNAVLPSEQLITLQPLK